MVSDHSVGDTACSECSLSIPSFPKPKDAQAEFLSSSLSQWQSLGTKPDRHPLSRRQDDRHDHSQQAPPLPFQSLIQFPYSNLMHLFDWLDSPSGTLIDCQVIRLDNLICYLTGSVLFILPIHLLKLFPYG